MTLRCALACALAVADLSVGGACATQQVGRSVGEAFPSIVLPALNGGRAMSLAAFRGKKVLLIEFASW